MSVILLILPDFLLIALGWVLLHRLGFDRAFFAGAEKLVYFILFPPCCSIRSPARRWTWATPRCCWPPPSA